MTPAKVMRWTQRRRGNPLASGPVLRCNRASGGRDGRASWIRRRDRGGGHRRARPCSDGGAAGQARGGDRPRRAGQRRVDPQFRLRHGDRPAGRRLLAARHALARRLGWRLRLQAGIRVEHEGLVVAARRPEAKRVLEAFCATEMGRDCAMLTPPRLPTGCRPFAATGSRARYGRRTSGASRAGRPSRSSARYLEEGLGVTFMRSTLVNAVGRRRLSTTRGDRVRGTVIVCPGHDLQTLSPAGWRPTASTHCKLHMMRVAPAAPVPLGAAVMSDLGLVRYLGYAELPEAAALKARLQAEQADALAQRRAPHRRAVRRRIARRRRQPPLRRDGRSLRAGRRWTTSSCARWTRCSTCPAAA